MQAKQSLDNLFHISNHKKQDIFRRGNAIQSRVEPAVGAGMVAMANQIGRYLPGASEPMVVA